MINRYIIGIRQKLPKGRKDNKFPYSNGALLILILIMIFIVPVYPEIYSTPVYPLLLSGIFISAVLSVHQNEKFIIIAAVTLTLLIWISRLIEAEVVSRALRIVQFLFFSYIIYSLITQISKKSSITLEVLIDAVAGYLLLGMAFSLLATTISSWIPSAYNVEFIKQDSQNSTIILQDHIYYAFMTFTTTGYGDIVPKHPLSKSLAVLISVTGQLYTAIIIAMLVGKYASSGNENH